MKSIFLALPLVVLTLMHSYTQTRAADIASPSPIAAESDINEVTENLKNRLKDTINSVSEVTPSPSPIAYVGAVKDIVQDTIVMNDKNGKKNVLVEGSAEIIRTPGNSSIKLENVAITDSIIAIGYKNGQDGELSGKRIIVSTEEFNPPAKRSGVATITKITKSALTLTESDGSTSLNLIINKDTTYKSISGPADFSDLTEGDKVIFSSLVDAKDNSRLTATVIMIIGSKNTE